MQTPLIWCTKAQVRHWLFSEVLAPLTEVLFTVQRVEGNPDHYLCGIFNWLIQRKAEQLV